MSTKPIATFGPVSSAAASAVLFGNNFGGVGKEQNMEGYDTYQLGSVLGSMFAQGDVSGTLLNQATLGLLDLSTGLIVSVTQPGKHYELRGRYKRLLIRQYLAGNPVSNAYLIAYESA